MSNSFFSNKKLSVFVTLMIILIGSIFYFSMGLENSDPEMSSINPTIYKGITLKAAYSDDGKLKVFAQNKNNKLAKLNAYEGNSIPEINSVVIGFQEAKMMKEENLFNKTGDKIKGLFGVNVYIEGILEETNSPIDEFHFVSTQTLNNLDGDMNKIFPKSTPEGVVKIFYNLGIDEEPKFDIKLIEGDIDNYNQIHEIAGNAYYPLIIGYKEAQMMKEEKLFSQPGDVIKGFFGKNVYVVGVIELTNSSLDMIHITPLKEEDLA